jgi:hypothetical protein
MNLSDLKFIAEGFINATRARFKFSSMEVEKKAAARYEICLACPILSDCKTKCDKDKGGCGCPLDMRTRSSKGCPKGKW